MALINAGLAHYERCREFPWLVELEIVAAETNEGRLPTPGELEQLYAIEDRLEEALSPAGAHLIAQQTWNGRRMVDFYVVDGPAACRLVDALVAQGAFERAVTMRTSRDDDWAAWMPTLIRMSDQRPASGGEDFGQAVLVRIPLSGGEFGSDEEQGAVLELADELAAIADELDAAEFDGHEFGGHEATLFAYGADADALLAAFEPTLRGAAVARGAVVTKRYGPPDDPAAREETLAL